MEPDQKVGSEANRLWRSRRNCYDDHRTCALLLLETERELGILMVHPDAEAWGRDKASLYDSFLEAERDTIRWDTNTVAVDGVRFGRPSGFV